MNPVKHSRLKFYAQDSFYILQTSLRLAKEGQTAFYRVAALQLRLLFCDTTRRHDRVEDISLVGKLFPLLQVHSITSWTPTSNPDQGNLIDWRTWLQQPTPAGIPIREFIRQVCDQDGGAHVDPHPSSHLDSIPDIAEWMLIIGETALAALEPYLGYTT